MARTSVALRFFPALEDICTSFEFKLLTNSYPMLWGEPTGLTAVTIKSGLMGPILIESVGEMGV